MLIELMTKEDEEIVKHIVQTLFDKKGFNIIVLDVQGISSATDYFVIAEGSVDRHVKALGNAIQKYLSDRNLKPLHVEGEAAGDWVVLDYGSFIVHIFTPGLRDKYAIEKLWSKGKIIDVEIDLRGEAG